MVARGSVISFDRVKGYGFVASESGGEDVFLHVNELLDDKGLIVVGQVVEFDLEEGDRGPKASRVRVVQGDKAAPRSEFRSSGLEPSGDDECDVLSPAELEREITEALLRVNPAVSGSQILAVREQVVAIARSHGWVDS